MVFKKLPSIQNFYFKLLS